MNKPDVINATEWTTPGNNNGDVTITTIKNTMMTSSIAENNNVIEQLQRKNAKFENRQIVALLAALDCHPVATEDTEIRICRALLQLSFHDVIESMMTQQGGGVRRVASLIRASATPALRSAAVRLLHKLARDHVTLTSSIVEAAVEPIYLHVIADYDAAAHNDDDDDVTTTFAAAAALLHHLARVQQRHRVLMQPDLIGDVISIVQQQQAAVPQIATDCLGFLAALTGSLRDVTVASQKVLHVRSLVRRRKHHQQLLMTSSSVSIRSALKTKSFAKPPQEGCDLLKDSKMAAMCCDLLRDDDVITGDGPRYAAEILLNLSGGSELWSDAARVVLGKERNLAVVVALLSSGDETVARDAVTILAYLNRAVTNQRFVGRFAMRRLVDMLLLGDHRGDRCVRSSVTTVIAVLETVGELLESRSRSCEENAEIFVRSCGVHVVKFLSVSNVHMDHEKVREMAKRLLASLWRNYSRLMARHGYSDSSYFLKDPTGLVGIK